MPHLGDITGRVTVIPGFQLQNQNQQHVSGRHRIIWWMFSFARVGNGIHRNKPRVGIVITLCLRFLGKRLPLKPLKSVQCVDSGFMRGKNYFCVRPVMPKGIGRIC